eukprot:Gb_04313 [translate_table: standard]
MLDLQDCSRIEQALGAGLQCCVDYYACDVIPVNVFLKVSMVSEPMALDLDFEMQSWKNPRDAQRPQAMEKRIAGSRGPLEAEQTRGRSVTEIKPSRAVGVCTQAAGHGEPRIVMVTGDESEES